jgi:hypothetical protein
VNGIIANVELPKFKRIAPIIIEISSTLLPLNGYRGGFTKGELKKLATNKNDNPNKSQYFPDIIEMINNAIAAKYGMSINAYKKTISNFAAKTLNIGIFPQILLTTMKYSPLLSPSFSSAKEVNGKFSKSLMPVGKSSYLAE